MYDQICHEVFNWCESMRWWADKWLNNPFESRHTSSAFDFIHFYWNEMFNRFNLFFNKKPPKSNKSNRRQYQILLHSVANSQQSSPLIMPFCGCHSAVVDCVRSSFGLNWKFIDRRRNRKTQIFARIRISCIFECKVKVMNGHLQMTELHFVIRTRTGVECQSLVSLWPGPRYSYATGECTCFIASLASPTRCSTKWMQCVMEWNGKRCKLLCAHINEVAATTEKRLNYAAHFICKWLHPTIWYAMVHRLATGTFSLKINTIQSSSTRIAMKYDLMDMLRAVRRTPKQLCFEWKTIPIKNENGSVPLLRQREVHRISSKRN